MVEGVVHMAKNYKLYAMIYNSNDGNINCVNSSYYTENMASAQSLFEEDLKVRGMIPLAILSEAQVKKKIADCIHIRH